MIPSKIGSWTVVDQLGEGGQGYVLRGKKRQLDGSQLEAAIKVPISDPSKLSDAGKTAVLSGLIHEFEMLKLISSQNVCKVVDSGIEPVKRGQKTIELPWLATELIKGEDLQTEVRNNGPLDEASWAQLSWDLATGLQAIHAVGATHLDLKPQNVVRHSRRSIIIDLGGASFVGKFDMGDVIQAHTISFAAPEQLDQKHDPEDYEYPVDLYSLGATLYFAATGRYLFEVDYAKDKKEAATKRFALMRKGDFDTSGLSMSQIDIITKLCKFQPSERLSLEQTKENLLEILAENDSRRGSSSSGPVNSKPPQERVSASTNTGSQKRDLDIGGWIATILLSFLPPLVGPFIRYFQLRDAFPKTSQMAQLRTLLVLGSLLSFGLLGSLAFFHKYQKDKSKITGSLLVLFSATSISFFLSTVIGTSLEQGSALYSFLQGVAGVGIGANILMISPLSAAIGVFVPKPTEPVTEEDSSTETNSD